LSKSIRIALCDDHAVVRSGLRRILDAEPGLEVIGEAGSVAEAIALAAQSLPDVFVMDLGLPDGSGLNATIEVRSVSPDAADSELIHAVRQVVAGHQYVHPTLGAALLAPDAPTARLAGPGGELSAREVDVLRLIALGLTNSEIGERLFVSVRTVETHRAHIQQKLNARTRAELVRLARDAGLLESGLPGDDDAP